MKQNILFMALILISVPMLARAEVFRCKSQGGIVYSEHPCATDATLVNHLAKKPSEENVREAQSRLDSNIRQLEEKERKEDQERRVHQFQRGASGMR